MIIEIPLAEAEKVIAASLFWMQAQPELTRPSVVVEDFRTMRFVQFCGGLGMPIVLDLPGRRRNLPCWQAASSLLGEPRLLPPSVGLTYEKRGLTPDATAALAMRVLRECLVVKDRAMLTITRQSLVSRD